MSEPVIITIAIVLLLAVVATLLFRGKLKVWWKDFGVTAEGGETTGTSMSMKAHGAESSIVRAKQTKEGSSKQNLEMDAKNGGKLTDVEQHDKQ